jgi:hypothetical protein
MLSVVYAECHVFDIVMLSVIMLSVFMLSVIIAECHYAECHYAERYYTACHYAECHYAECHYAECHYAECFILSVILLSVIIFISQLLCLIYFGGANGVLSVDPPRLAPVLLYDSKGTLFAFLALLTGTHTLAYFSKAPVTKKFYAITPAALAMKKSFITLTPGPAL